MMWMYGYGEYSFASAEPLSSAMCALKGNNNLHILISTNFITFITKIVLLLGVLTFFNLTWVRVFHVGT